jgi:hypothetical protein
VGVEFTPSSAAHPYQELHVVGYVTDEQMGGAFAALLEAAATSGTWSMLVDARDVVWTPSLKVARMSAEAFAERADKARYRGAQVMPVEPSARLISEHIATVFLNRGLNSAEFDAREPAIAWLLGADA